MRTLLPACLVVALAFACGGGGGGPAADGGPGPDAQPMITGLTAEGVYPLALARAKALLPDAVLFQIRGEFIDATTGEVDPENVQSYWDLHFVSLGEGKGSHQLFLQGEFVDQPAMPFGVETIRVIESAWMDSGEVFAALAASAGAGFETPDPTDVHTHTTMSLAMWAQGGGLMDLMEPIWSVGVISAPPGMPVKSQEWLVTEGEDVGGTLICPPIEISEQCIVE